MKVNATGPAFRRRGNNGERVQTQWQAERQRGTILPMHRPSVWARLMGFPDDFCRIEYRGKPASDGPIYKALGNSWAVPCGGWILDRIAKELESA